MALDWLTSSNFDAVLTDIELPGMTLLQMAGEIRGRDPLMPILVMTAHPSVDYAVTALCNQIDEFPLKPVSGAELISKLTDLVELGRTRRAAGDRVVILTLSRGARAARPCTASTSRWQLLI